MTEQAGEGGSAGAPAPAPEPAPAEPSSAGSGAPEGGGGTEGAEPADAAAGNAGEDPGAAEGAEAEPAAESPAEGPEDTAAGEGTEDAAATEDTAASEGTAATEDAATEDAAATEGAADAGGEEPGSPSDSETPRDDAGPQDHNAEAPAQEAPAEGQEGGKSEFSSLVDSIATPPHPPDKLHEIADSTAGVGDDLQPARDEADRFAHVTTEDWPDAGGEQARTRSAESVAEADEIAADARAMSQYARTSAAEIDSARADGQATTAHYEAEDAKAQTMLSSAGERDLARQHLAHQAAAENQQRYATAAENVRQAAPALGTAESSRDGATRAADGNFDWGPLDPRDDNPVMDELRRLVNGTGEAVQDAGRWLLTIKPEGPDAGVSPPTGPGGDTIGSVDGHAHADHGRWEAFGGAVQGEYSLGVDGSGQLNRPGSEDPLVKVETQGGIKANLDEIPLIDAGPLSASITPEARLGPGIDVEFNPSWENGTLDLNGKVSASPIVGGGLGFDVQVDVNEILQSLDSVRRGAFG